MRAKQKNSCVCTVVLCCATMLLAMSPPAMGREEGACPIPNDPEGLIGVLFPIVDADGSGGISLGEIAAFYPVESYMFDIVDSDGDGQVSRNELVTILPLLEALLGGSVLSFVDINGDGVVAYGEISDYVTPAQFGLLDQDGNGLIDCADLEESPEGELPEGEISDECFLPRDLGSLYFCAQTLLDTNGDGGLSKAEIRAIVPDVDAVVRLWFEEPIQDFDSAFAVLDLNLNGVIRDDEIFRFFTRPSDEALSNVDTNNNRVIEHSELLGFVSLDNFAVLDRNANGVLDHCDTQISPVEGEAEGEMPEGEPGICPLPADAFDLILFLLPALDINGDTEITQYEIRTAIPNVDTLLAGLLDGEVLPQWGVPLNLGIVFDVVDANNNDRLEVPELCQVVMAFGGEVLSEIDANGNQVIEYAEFGGFVTERQFALLDRNGNGAVDCEDAPLPAIGTGPGLCPLPEDPFALITFALPAVDLNGDGGLSKDEILAYLPNANELLLELGDEAGIPGLSLDMLFGIVDANGDGVCRLAEAKQWIDMLLRGTRVLDFIDANGDQVIAYEEIAAYATQAQFVVLDANGNGYLDCGDIMAGPSEGELEGELEGEPEGGPEGEIPVYCPLPNDGHLLVTLLWAKVDLNSDGGLSIQELTAFSPGWAEQMMLWYDLDDSAGLSFEEMVAMAQETLEMVGWSTVDFNGDGGLQWSEIAALSLLSEAYFARLDANNDGVLDCKDLPSSPPVPDPLAVCRFVGLALDMFWTLDANRDGALTLDEVELPVIMGADALLVEPLPPMPDFGALFAAYDLNGDARVTRVELEAVRGRCGGNTPGIDPVPVARRLVELFPLIDANGDGNASLPEVNLYMPMAPEFLQQIDLNGDGGVSLEELQQILTEAGGGFNEDDPLIQMRRHVEGNGFYAPGEVLTIVVTLTQTRTGSLGALGLSETLPAGWTLAEVATSAGAEVLPEAGQAGTLEFAWLVMPSFPARIVYRVNVPESASGTQVISGEALYRTAVSTELTSGVVETVVGEGAGVEWVHSADTDRNWCISLTEMLRTIQFFNSEGYHCAADTEDGYAPGLDEGSGCGHHDCDYMIQDWIIDLSELLRMIQLFNAPGQGYYAAQGTEDGFAPVLDKRN